MPDLNKADLVRAFAQGFHDSVDAVPWQAEDHIDTPIMNGINQNVGCRAFHEISPF